MLTVKQVTKNFTQGKNEVEVLKGVDFELASGATASILGPSGSGKSTFLNIVAGLEVPDSGEVRFEGELFSEFPKAVRDQHRFEKFGFVFQQFNLLDHLNVFENVIFPLELKKRDHSARMTNDILESVGLSHRRDHYPSTLSGGERQRVAIARALVDSPRLILADEPSGSLDIDSGSRVTQLFFNLVREKKCSLILVTHDPNLARECDQTYHMSDGLLVRENQ